MLTARLVRKQDNGRPGPFVWTGNGGCNPALSIHVRCRVRHHHRLTTRSLGMGHHRFAAKRAPNVRRNEGTARYPVGYATLGGPSGSTLIGVAPDNCTGMVNMAVVTIATAHGGSGTLLGIHRASC